MTLFAGWAFLSKKKNDIRVGQAWDGRKSRPMSLFSRQNFLSVEKNNVKAAQARDGRRSGRLTLFVPKPQTVEALQSVFLGRNPKRDDPPTPSFKVCGPRQEF